MDVMTPFPIEFVRKSRQRGGAPTVVPYNDGGPVRAHACPGAAYVS